jgi:hypothetical protein
MVYHGVLFFENKNLSKDDRTFDNAPSGVTTTYSVNFEYSKTTVLFYIGMKSYWSTMTLFL